MAWAWIQENASGLQVVTSVAMVVIWLVYLHLILLGFLRQRRSSLLINRAGRRDIRARCLISNMGVEPAYILDVLAEIETDDGFVTASVVDWEEVPVDRDSEPGGVSRQGPLNSGEHFVLGTFEELIDRAAHRFGEEALKSEARSIFLIVLASTNQARHVVAAGRKFEVRRDVGKRVADLDPVQPEAIQVRSGARRRRLGTLLEQFQHRETTQDSMYQAILGPRSR